MSKPIILYEREKKNKEIKKKRMKEILYFEMNTKALCIK